MKYAVIGTGAIGGYYGSKLQKAGCEVHFLLHRDYEFVKERGLQVDSCDGSFHLDKVNAYSSTVDMPVADVVLVALKSVNNHLLRDLLPPVVGERTLVVLIQNGIGLEADLQEMFPSMQIAAGLAFICSGKTQPGHINHQCYGSINIGNYSCKDTEMISRLLSDLHSADIEAQEVQYDEARWKKAMWNMPFNGMTVAMNTTTDRLLSDPVMEQLIRDQMMEIVEAARALNVKNVDEAFVEKMIAMTKDMVPYSPSMKLDYDFHRPMEIHYIYTRAIEEAKKAGVHMKKLEMLSQQLQFIENNLNT